MYYVFIVLSVTLFGGCFALQDVFRRLNGSSVRISLQFSWIGALASFVFLTAVNGFVFEYTHFTLLMAMLSALNACAFTLCSFKALDRINLSLYSLFSMLGGMALPFVQGIVFYGEPITAAKLVCFAFITAALALTLQRGERKRGTVYYAAVFVLNGMSGVLAKIFSAADLPKTSATGFTNLTSLCTVAVSLVLLATRFRKKADQTHLSLCSGGIAIASGILNKLANLLLVVALAHVDASVQYPMVTGGVIIVSTLICCFGSNKPSKKELASVALSFIGLLLLFALP